MTIAPGLAEAELTDTDIQLKVVWLLGFCLECVLYGVDLCLFMAALPVLIRSDKNVSATVFLIGNVVIFVVASIESGASICRALAAFGYQRDVKDPIRIYSDTNYWATYLPLVLGIITFTTGDILMIYRCFLIWQRRYWVILLPVTLATVSAGFHIATVWYARQGTCNLFLWQNRRWAVLPTMFSLSQTILTTGLIVWRIWSHYRQRTTIRLASVHTPCLPSIAYIIMESAAAYTAGMFFMLILISLDHPAKEVLRVCMIPITGIVFVLMALRTHAVWEKSQEMPASPSLMPTWLVEPPGIMNSGSETVGEDPPRHTQTQHPPLGHQSDDTAQA
ncbi:hypothetical protein BKA70DRAFT_55145 [Coprinopsis sp. MPI-PUGE-AT-0042]|nr:hypothetical protein BKA70DRAFT_55145 [Coprinopsis sp. MPI-PUGE-AT-0042]